MHDMIDSFIPPRKIGRITGKLPRLAIDARRAVRAFGVTTTIFVESSGLVFAQPAAYIGTRPGDDIVGNYASDVSEQDIVDDLRATVSARLAAIGILEDWSDTCQAA